MILCVNFNIKMTRMDNPAARSGCMVDQSEGKRDGGMKFWGKFGF